MKGIILAGGTGSRLHPMTISVSKQLMPIYDKPMIYYPLTTLIEAGINEILVISTSRDTYLFEHLLGNGSQWGVEISYAEQREPRGIAEAFVIGEEFIEDDSVVLILGDNIFWSEGLGEKIFEAGTLEGATIFAHHVNNPEIFGVIEFEGGVVTSIEEKPEIPKSNYVSTGLYVYDNDVINIAKSLKPSKRLEYEITDVNNSYLSNNSLRSVTLGRGSAWLDTGTVESMAESAEFIRVIQNRQGISIGSPEEAALNKGFITKDKVLRNAQKMGDSLYAEYLKKLYDSTNS